VLHDGADFAPQLACPLVLNQDMVLKKLIFIIGPHPKNVRREGQERATGLSGMRRNRSGDVLKGERGKMLLDKLQSLVLVLLYYLGRNDMLQ